jgi:hypothetical protein
MKTPREILMERHSAAESKLDAIRKEVVASEFEGNERRTGLVETLWQELILPCRRIWVGLAATWAIILVVNLLNGPSTETIASKQALPGPEVVAALREQRQLFTQLLEPLPPSPATRPNPPGPRGAAPQFIRFA